MRQARHACQKQGSRERMQELDTRLAVRFPSLVRVGVIFLCRRFIGQRTVFFFSS